MNNSNVHKSLLSACMILLSMSSTSNAEVYKWVDANGETHYSENKEDAGKANAKKLKALSEPSATDTANSSTQYWQEQEGKVIQLQAPKLNDKPYVPPVDTRPVSLSGGKSDSTDASRCRLARDVISGAVTHPNGAPTDKHDREVAENDIRAFCD
jgi:hypothetical protein